LRSWLLISAPRVPKAQSGGADATPTRLVASRSVSQHLQIETQPAMDLSPADLIGCPLRTTMHWPRHAFSFMHCTSTPSPGKSWRNQGCWRDLRWS